MANQIEEKSIGRLTADIDRNLVKTLKKDAIERDISKNSLVEEIVQFYYDRNPAASVALRA